MCYWLDFQGGEAGHVGLLSVTPQQLGDLNLTGRVLNLAMLLRVVEWSQAPKQSLSQVLFGHWEHSCSLHSHHSERKRKPKSMVLCLMSYISAASTSCQST